MKVIVCRAIKSLCVAPCALAVRPAPLLGVCLATGLGVRAQSNNAYVTGFEKTLRMGSTYNSRNARF